MKYKLSEIGKVVGGGTPSTKHPEYYTGSGIPWLTPKDLSGYDKMYISKGGRDITQEGLENSSAKLLPANSVLVSSRAPIGYVAIAENEIATNQGFKSIIPNRELVIPEYLYFVMKTSKQDLEQIASGSTFKEVSTKVMSNFEVEIPDLDEQRKVLDYLLPITRKIEKNSRINDNLSKFRELLYMRLIQSSDVKEVKLTELFNIAYGKNIAKSELTKSGTKVFGANGLIGYTQKPSIISAPTVTITSRGSGSGYVSYLNIGNAFLTNNLLYLNENKNLGLSFSYETIKSANPKQFVTGSAQPQLTIKNLSQSLVKIPSDIN
ncbi:restriction endonuclease subunit S [Ligilactobacillus animalis]|uniref:restriction endonuclease subunit S n=1 Tax=Ligilactobacillus animalis TaxID=1605 RepID=UPI000825E540|nr:restriction endonuclease subunit S [Ligilactobacillus animalis]OCX48012.1 hypothetical protein BFC98_07350 [Ligilactobacillus animalis]QHQ70367.1 restriction endonuclease subunit S [Ligilactobacillus animalis]